MPLLSRKCSSCGRRYDVLSHKGEETGLDDQPDDAAQCPDCGSVAFEGLITCGTGILLGGGAGTGKTYPYYDRGLGCHVDSDAHRRRICKERGLIPVDGDFDPVKEAARREDWAGQDKALAEYEAYTHDLDNSPHFAGYRQARDKGMVHDRFKPRDTDDYWSR